MATKHEPKSKRSYRSGTCKHCGLYIVSNTPMWGPGWFDFEAGEQYSEGRKECPGK